MCIDGYCLHVFYVDGCCVIVLEVGFLRSSLHGSGCGINDRRMFRIRLGLNAFRTFGSDKLFCCCKKVFSCCVKHIIIYNLYRRITGKSLRSFYVHKFQYSKVVHKVRYKIAKCHPKTLPLSHI